MPKYWLQKMGLKLRSQKIKLGIAEGFHTYYRIKRSSQCLPNWFKKLKGSVEHSFPPESTVKKCVPFLDAMKQDFTVTLWSDLYISVRHAYAIFDKENNQIYENGAPVFLGGLDDPNKLIGDQYNNVEICRIEYVGLHMDAKFHTHVASSSYFHIGLHSQSQTGGEWTDTLACKNVLKFNAPVKIETPVGYSVYYKPPANDFANKIRVIEGLVETDKYLHEVNFPFVWTGNEEGDFVIPAGTPIVQCLIIQRHGLKSEHEMFTEKDVHPYWHLFEKGQDRYKNIINSVLPKEDMK